jgi:dTDP-4-amino-4,6-dideoxygalactose transaminase
MKNKSNNQKKSRSRRTFIQTTGLASAGLIFTSPEITIGGARTTGFVETLALEGGPKAVTATHDDSETWPRYGAEEEKAVIEVLRNPGYKPNDLFEEAWQKRFNVPYCKAHFNGTSAITAMFFALKLPPGSEIMVPCSTFWATVTPMRFFGLVPVFVDINPVTGNFDLEDAKKKVTKNTRAMFPVHISGMPADIDHISDFCKEKGLILLEDACHAHGAKLKGREIGSWGRMACYSFQASKPLPSIEGGMGNYQNKEDYDRATMLGHYEFAGRLGKDSSYSKYTYGFGMKLRMHPLAAALGKCQLEKLDNRNAILKAQVRKLNDRITKLPGLYEQQNRNDVDRVYYSGNSLYFNEKEAGFSRDALIKALNAEGVWNGKRSVNSSRSRGNGRGMCDNPIFQEAEWWHHPPVIADRYPGLEERGKRGLGLPYFTREMPELTGQYIAAFEKVWAHRKYLASL